MNVRWTYRHCGAHKNEARGYWQEKLPRLERVLSRFGPERCRLDMTLYFYEGRKGWELRAALYTPTGLMVTDEEGDDLHAVLDEVADELVRQIQRHKSKVRKEHLQRRRRQQRDQQQAAAQSLQSDFEVQRPAAFFELFKPLMSSVQSHAASELRILEIEEAIPTGEVTVDDLVDDVLVTAWESYGDRPQHTPIDVWLMGILHERLVELQECFGDVKLSSPVDSSVAAEGPEFDVDDLQYWLSQALEPVEALSIEDVLAGEDTGGWLERLEAQEQHQQILSLLKRLPKHQRQAFMLSEVEGFDLAEIALALDRSEAEVTSDIEEARTTLRDFAAQIFP